jgi:hypothetical protein
MLAFHVYGGYASLYIVFLAKLWLFHRFKLTLAFLWFLMFFSHSLTPRHVSIHLSGVEGG